MKKNNIIELNDNEIKLLINDVRNILNNDFPIYAVDTYDIVKYSFPYTIGFEHNSNIEETNKKIRENLIGYTKLFYEYEYSPILLNEYFIELKGIANKVNTYKKKYSNPDVFIKKLYNDFEKAKKLNNEISFFEKNIIKILSLRTFLGDEIKKFKNLINNRIQVQDFKLTNNFQSKNQQIIDDSKILKSIIINTEPNYIIVSQIFKRFKEKYDFTGSNKEALLVTTLTDILAMVRLDEINNKIKQSFSDNKLSKKYSFLFLSSTPKKSKILEKLYFEILEDENKPYLLRNIYHVRWTINLYQNILKKQKNNEFAKVLNEYERGFIEGRKLISNLDVLLRSNANEDKLNYENKIVFENLMNNNDIKKLQKTIQNIKIQSSNSKTSVGKENTYSIFEKLIDVLKDTNNQEYVANSKNDLFLRNTSINFYLKSSIAKNNSGKDFVQSRIQRLPLLFFHSINLPLNIQKIFTDDLYELVSENTVKFRFEEIKKHYISIYNSEYKLFIIFMNILYSNKVNKEEEEFISVLQHLLILSEDSDNLNTEVLYLLIWLMRRQNKKKYYVNSIKLLKNYDISDKPRLLHGKSLLLLSYAKFYKDDYFSINYYNKGLKLAIKSLETFKTNFNLKKNYKKVFILTLIGLINTIIDTKNNIANLEKDYKEYDRKSQDIYSPRYLLNEIKFILKINENSKISFLKSPALMHTEFELECNEIKYYLSTDDKKMTKSIIDEADKLGKYLGDIKVNDKLTNQINKAKIVLESLKVKSDLKFKN